MIMFLDIWDEIKYSMKINFTCFGWVFLNITIGIFKSTFAKCFFIFLSDNIAERLSEALCEYREREIVMRLRFCHFSAQNPFKASQMPSLKPRGPGRCPPAYLTSSSSCPPSLCSRHPGLTLL